MKILPRASIRMMVIQVLFFATLREKAGINKISLDVPLGATVGELKDILKGAYPGLGQSLDSSLVSINKEFASEGDEIPGSSEVAFFPPVSGGQDPSLASIGPTIISITEDELNLNELIVNISSPSTGAVCIFTGLVRGITSRKVGSETKYLDYEAYLPMAEAKIKQTIEEIRLRWPDLHGIAVVQRIGRLYPSTPTVVIACSAAHRDSGIFEAAHYGINRLKEIVPIWKKETGPNGNFWVEGDYYPVKGE